MAWASPKRSIEYNDSEKYDRAVGVERNAPDYPPGMCFGIPMADLEKAGAEGGDPDDTMHFAAMGEVTNTMRDREGCRIEVELTQFAGEDGKFFELSRPCHICFCGPELEKLEMSDNAERGDMVHLIGTARLESVSDNEFMGKMASLQITELSYEDESAESRGGEDA